MRPACIALLCLILLACGGDRPQPGAGGDPYLGNLADTSYANRRGKAFPTAAGGELRLDDHEGRWVWVDFAAPWCPPCVPQSQVMLSLESRLPDDVVVLTLLTSDDDPMTPATPATARAWAGRFGLRADRVAVCGETRFLPSHMLFSPRGQLLLWREGLMPADEILGAIREQRAAWPG